jgi:uncharacterized protein YfaS (alpha-2-macroglobulin family)
MRYWLFFFLLTLLTTNALAQKKNRPSAEPYDAEFRQADSLINAGGLPKSAVIVLRDIYTRARKANQPVQMLKAQLYLMQAAGQYQEGADTAAIQTAVAEAKESAFPYNAVWHSIAAQLYHGYYQQHQWQILQRTAVNTEAKQPMDTWDAPRFFTAITSHYDASLEDEQRLKSIDLKTFAPVLNGNPETRHLRPTLFDLLAFRAVAYYRNDEQGITQPAYRFTISDPAYLDDAAKFTRLNITSKDTASRHLRTLQLYQSILTMHAGDNEPDALIDADLHRLEFVYSHATFPNKKELYSKALSRLVMRYPENATTAEASYRRLALQYEAPVQPRGEAPANRPAHDLAGVKAGLEAIVAKFPGSEGGIHAQQLISIIVAPQLAVQGEEAILPGEYSKLLVTYKRTPEVWGRVIRLTEADYNKVIGNNPRIAKELILAANATRKFSFKMPAADDYEQHTTELPVEPLDAGIYAVLLSADATFSENDNNLCYTLFQATTISYVTQQGKGSGYVLHRNTGRPLGGAQLDFYTQEWKSEQYAWVKKASAQSAANGSFSIVAKNLYTNRTVIRHGGETFIANAGIYAYGGEGRQQASTQTFFFTDRSIYRPGQTIYFKGITVRKEVNAVKTAIVAGKAMTIRFTDVNGQLVKKMELTTNEFGSFTGTFAAPSTGLTGEMSIASDDGSTSLLVEEYKRPKFAVQFDTLKSSYALDEQVTITGNANAYAGNVIDGATVKYRVVRKTRWPYPWLYRRMIMPSSESMEITNGVAATDAQGKFAITFTALPDASVDTALQPVFTYTVYADVTDAAGETHSAEAHISVGYRSIRIVAAIPAKADPKELKTLQISLQNLNGQPLKQEGTLTIRPLTVPGTLLRTRLWPAPDQYVLDEPNFRRQFPLDEYRSESKPEEWAAGAPVYQQSFTSNEQGMVAIPGGTLKQGWYELAITARDTRSGALIEDRRRVQVGTAGATPLSAVLDKTTYEPGEQATATVTSSFKEAHILQVETRVNNQTAQQQYEYTGVPQKWTIRITEADRGGIALQWLIVRNNRVYMEDAKVNILWTSKDLAVTWAAHRDQLAPGAKETWTVTIKGSKKEKVAAELLAGLYDASLDALKPHNWGIYGLFPMQQSATVWNKEGGFGVAYNRELAFRIMPELTDLNKEYEHLMINEDGYGIYQGRAYKSGRGGVMREAMAAAPVASMPNRTRQAPGSVSLVNQPQGSADQAGIQASSIQAKYGDESGGITAIKKDISLRKNLQETAFFFPQLKTNATSDISFSFTLPEALTEWKFMALAHTKDAAVGELIGMVKTQKDFMVQPNLPRFLRQGDNLTITTKISNLSLVALTGTANLEIVDAQTGQPANLAFRLKTTSVSFIVARAQSTTASWSLHIPESRYEPVLIRITAQAGTFTDGEENMLPVLSNRTLVTETLPLWMNGTGSKTFTFNKLLQSNAGGKSPATLSHHRLTLEYTANPAWYAVQALPYLMEYLYECAEQTFNRYYANTLAAHIIDKAPKVKAIFAQWKEASATRKSEVATLQSALQKNAELKSALLEETPWVLEAQDEAAQKRNIALLFDSYKLGTSREASLKKLEDMLLPEGAFPWFKGGGPDRYITQYIATGLARLQHLGAADQRAAGLQQKMQTYLDRQIAADYDALVRAKAKLDDQHISYAQLQYLYLCSFNSGKAPDNKTAFNYYKGQAAKHWTALNPYGKGMAAVALHRLGDKNIPSNILQSLRETAVHKEELGMYWMEPGAGYWWYEAPVEAQSLLIECFSEVGNKIEEVDEQKRWLLKQKQMQNWRTTKATADACYALLLSGSDWLTEGPVVTIKLGNETLRPSKTEAGTGYFKQAFAAGEVKPEMGHIAVTVSNLIQPHSNTSSSRQPSYGAVYWQYFENYDKLTSAATPLALRRQLYIEHNTDRGSVLEEIKDNNRLKIGDKVKVRIVLQADRDMEYIHLKDTRAAAFEPLNVLSGYRWQQGLGYYESTRDASSSFFIPWLRKGTYVFEYGMTVMAKGDFSNGLATVQCMYAPEFSSHSEGGRIVVE